MPTRGAGIVKPTTVDNTGGSSSATINTNGSVTFSACATLSLNGVFSADFDNYMIVMRWQQNTSSPSVYARLRLSGTDATGTSDYNDQSLSANSTTISGVRSTTNGYWIAGQSSQTYRNGLIMHIYGPYLAQPTAYRTITADSTSGARIEDHAGTHELSTAYDGITLYPNANDIGGLICVYGLRN